MGIPLPQPKVISHFLRPGVIVPYFRCAQFDRTLSYTEISDLTRKILRMPGVSRVDTVYKNGWTMVGIRWREALGIVAIQASQSGLYKLFNPRMRFCSAQMWISNIPQAGECALVEFTLGGVEYGQRDLLAARLLVACAKLGDAVQIRPWPHPVLAEFFVIGIRLLKMPDCLDESLAAELEEQKIDLARITVERLEPGVFLGKKCLYTIFSPN